MKKLAWLMVFFFVSAQAYASWTVSGTIHENSTTGVRLSVTAVSDGTAPEEYKLSTITGLSAWDAHHKGSFLWQVTTSPVTATNTWNVSLDNDLGADISTLTGLTTAQAEYHTLKTYQDSVPLVFDVQIAFDAALSLNDQVVIYFDFLK